MSRGPTRNANPARPVRCSAGCGTLVWLKGALPTAADAEFFCASCTAAKLSEGPHLSDRSGRAEDDAASPTAPLVVPPCRCDTCVSGLSG